MEHLPQMGRAYAVRHTTSTSQMRQLSLMRGSTMMMILPPSPQPQSLKAPPCSHMPMLNPLAFVRSLSLLFYQPPLPISSEWMPQSVTAPSAPKDDAQQCQGV